jgi:hypothetical protein
MCNAQFQCACTDPAQTVCNGTCVNTKTDNSNCGGCGYTCTNCTNGQCIVTLASGLSNVTGIAIDSINVYVTTNMLNGNIYSMSKLGGGPNTLTGSYPQAAPLGIAVDNTYIYWTNVSGGTVMRMPLGGGVMPVAMASAQPTPQALAVNGTHLYWTNTADQLSGGGLFRIPLSSPGATPERMYQGTDAWQVALDASYAYVVIESPGIVVKVDLSLKTPTQLTGFENLPTSIGIDNDNVYFAGTGDARQVPKTPSTPLKPDIVLGGTSDGPTGLASDGTNVYAMGWTNLWKCPVGVTNGCKAIVTGPAGNQYVAVDATSVYWTNSMAGTVMKLTPK